MAINPFTKVCVACEIELRSKQNGVLVVEATTWGFQAIYQADVWYCPVCQHEVIVGVGNQPIYRHWEGDLLHEVKRREARGERVILCWLNQREKELFLRRGAELEKAEDQRKDQS